MRRPAWLTRNVFAIGLVSLFTDAASEMVMPFLPLFITTVLGGTALSVGLIEGSADTVASFLRLVAGRAADAIGRNQPLMVAGYTLSSIVRPLVALAGAPLHVLAVRVTDRVGKGLRSSPRDALLAANLDPNHASLVYSFHRAMDHFGAAIGPLLALAVLAVVGDDLRLLFLCSAIPGVLAVATATFFVREHRARRASPSSPGGFWGGPATLRVGYSMRRLLAPLALFTLANASEAFLLLRASEVTAGSLTTLPLLWVALHLVKSVASPMMGALADRRGATQSVAVGFALFVAIYAGLAFVESRAAVFALFLLYGIHVALIEGPQKALVAQLAHAGERATAFGWYHMTVGLLTLPGALLFGYLWDTHGHGAAFATGATLGCAALALWLIVPPLQSHLQARHSKPV